MKVYFLSLIHILSLSTLLQYSVCTNRNYDVTVGQDNDDIQEGIQVGIKQEDEITSAKISDEKISLDDKGNIKNYISINKKHSLKDELLNGNPSQHFPSINLTREVPIKFVEHYLTEFQPITLKYYIKRASHDPVCVLHTDKESSQDFEKKINNFWNSLPSDDLYARWKIGFFDITEHADFSGFKLPSLVPSLRCYIGTAIPQDYSGKGTKKHLRKWFKKLYSLHIERLPEARRSTIDDVITMSGNFTVLTFPGVAYHFDVEMILVTLSDRFKASVNFLMVHPGSVDEDGLKRRFSVQQEPTVIVLDRKGWKKGSIRTLARFTDSDVTQENLESFLVSQTFNSAALNLKNFRQEVIEGVKGNQAILVCFHAAWGVDNSHYLNVFNHSQQTLKQLNVGLRFGLVDLQTDAEVVHRWVNASSSKSVPFSVLFWFSREQDMTAMNGSAHQAILQSGLPTPWNIAKFIQNQGLQLLDRAGNELEISVFSATSDIMSGLQSKQMCSVHGNTSQPQLEIPNIISKPNERKLEKKMANIDKPIKKRVKQIGTLTQITKSNWHSLIEKSHPARDSLYLTKQQLSSAHLNTHQQSAVIVKVSAVFFIRNKCSNCARKLTVFEKIRKAAQFIKGASVYIMNCSDDTEMCEQLQIRGFPTVSAFRSISEEGIEHCLFNNHNNLIRVDYHGHIEENQIMAWFSRVSIPVAEFSDWTKLDNKKLEQNEEVRIIATLFPSHLSYQYMRSASGHTDWFPYECLALACEHLFGVAKCYGALSKNIPVRELKSVEQDLVVSEIIMQRKDGVEALIMRANAALFLTLQDDSSKKLHKFHKPHRYNIRNNQRCEDDHRQCSYIISSFVRDHSRLPVTHLTMDSFHTSTGFAVDHDSGGSIFSSGQPVLIALVHRENISSDSLFLEALTDAAYKFYNKVVITTLSVKEFPQWATRFVPHGYHRYVLDVANEMTDDLVPSLHVYPRLCIVHGNDHQRAAFYPRRNQFQLQSRQSRIITVTEITDFLNDFFEDPEGMMIKTENF